MIFDILLKDGILKMENAKCLFTAKTNEIDFSLTNFRFRESIGSLLAVASTRCNQVRVYFETHHYPII